VLSGEVVGEIMRERPHWVSQVDYGRDFLGWLGMLGTAVNGLRVSVPNLSRVIES
jgi:hypothetical protein